MFGHGHPITSGSVDTVDYFVSSSLFEPYHPDRATTRVGRRVGNDDADAHGHGDANASATATEVPAGSAVTYDLSPE